MGMSGKRCNPLESYLADRLQKVILNGQASSWRLVLAGVPKSSILATLLFLVYINDLPGELKSNAELFADDKSLLAVAKDKNESADILNDDLHLISKWAFNWKMFFNPYPSKPVQEVLFSRKNRIQNHPTISLNNVQVKRLSYQKHLGLILDEKLNFKQHIERYICNKKASTHFATEIICKAFLRPPLDCGDIIYDQSHNLSFCEKLEAVQ